ncbi:hypothetical protein OAC71_00235 [Candidatus Thioglobus sp.]|nr:hypothetical protein [Candidatus Thioglobus sp.]
MKKLLTTLLLSLLFICLAYAGGDDRDQVLPINSLNEVIDESPKFLKEDELVETQSDENIEEVIEAEHSKKEPALSIETSDESVIMNKTVASIKKYFMSDQGILVLLILFVLGLILLFNFFVREKSN